MAKEILIHVLFIFSFNFSFSQNQHAKSKNYCSEIISQVSKNWKLDSLGYTKFRKSYVRKFLHSKIDSVSNTYLLQNLGNPNKTWKADGKIEYVYYYFSGNLSSGHIYTEYLIFSFDARNLLLLSIRQSDNDPS